MEASKSVLSFNWDEFDTSSKSDDNSYGLSISECDSDDNYNGEDLYNIISNKKQLQNSCSSTTTQAKTILSDEVSIEKPKKKRRKRKKATEKKNNENPADQSPEDESKTQTSEQIEGSKTCKKKKYKNKYVKYWKDRFENYYKNDKKFNLNIIREEEGPFLFKLQLEYCPMCKTKGKGKSKKTKQPQTIADTKISDDKFKSKILSFFK